MIRSTTHDTASGPHDALGTAPVDREFALMGTHIRVVVGNPTRAGLATPAEAADAVEALLVAYDAALSRFRPGSELSRLNADPRERVPASELMRSAIGAALEAAELTDGLVDPALLDELETAGYRETWNRARRAPLREALNALADVPRRPASPRPGAPWRAIRLDDAAGVVVRPIGMRLDTGGSGKGHAADLAAALLDGFDAWAVDCGGDLRIGGSAGLVRDVEVEHPFTGEMFQTVQVRDGAVATSGLRSRIWHTADGRISHHLIDPATGEPAFTGLVAATALAPTAVQAEALAKAAVLAGPRGARLVLARHGGLTVDEHGQVERIGRLEPAPRVTLRLNGKTLR